MHICWEEESLLCMFSDGDIMKKDKQKLDIVKPPFGQNRLMISTHPVLQFSIVMCND